MKQKFTTLTLIISFLLGVGMLAAADETKKDSKDSSKPSYGEKLVEPDDAVFYKFKINPVTPKKGLTGGCLIYWGHYVKPPYQIEVRGKGLDATIYINNLQIYPPRKDWSEKISKRWREKHIDTLDITFTKEQEARSSEAHKILMEVEKEYGRLIRKNKLSEEGIQKIIKELKMFLKSHPKIDKYKVDSINSFKYHIKGHSIFAVENFSCDNPESFLKSKETILNEKIQLHTETIKGKVRLDKQDLTNSSFCMNVTNGTRYSQISQIKETIKILKSKEDISTKIKKLKEMSVIGNIYNAKIIYYNLDYLAIEKILEKKDE